MYIDTEGDGALDDEYEAYLSDMLDSFMAQRYILGEKIRRASQRLLRSRTARTEEET